MSTVMPTAVTASLFSMPLLAWVLLSWLLPLLGALGARFGLWPWWLGFILCAVSALLALGLLISVPNSACRPLALLGAVPLLLPLAFVLQLLRAPLVNDISTDINQPPTLSWAQELRTAQDNPLASGAIKALSAPPAPLHSRLTPAEIQTEALALMQELGWQARLSADGVEGVVTSFAFGFKDDVALRLRLVGAETRVDMRSASRQGRSDLGANHARITRFLVRLNERLGQAYKSKQPSHNF
ncbi:MAG: DUF1499 domain-containing protein [Aeromonas sp.]